MIKRIERPWFQVWGSELAQNRTLKGLLTLTVLLCVAETAALVFLVTRPPTLIAVGLADTKFLFPNPPALELVENEVKRVATEYLARRHTWEWTTVDSAIRDASKYIDPKFIKKFLEHTASQVKLAKSKKVSQRFYVASLSIDPGTQTIRVTGDRILLLEGLRAVTPQTFSISFALGARTKDNPEGVYITGDNLIPEPNEQNPTGGTK